MSTCISMFGEYSDHELANAAEPFTCQRCFVFDETAAVVEIRRLRSELEEARGDRPSGFWSQREWEDWSNDLATLIPEGDVSHYSNPEGAQEGIISDCLAAYIEERQVG